MAGLCQPALFLSGSQVGPVLCSVITAGRLFVPLAKGTQVFPVLLVSSSDSSDSSADARGGGGDGGGAWACYLESPQERRRQEEGWAGAGWTGRAEEVSFLQDSGKVGLEGGGQGMLGADAGSSPGL